MKKIALLLILLFVNITNTKLISNNDKKYRHNLLRKLWDEDMPEPKDRDKEEETSLAHCAKSDYKYFSYILSGAPLNYSHSMTTSYGAVRK
jgi:hypothetical protein